MEKWKMKVRRKSADYNKSHFVRYRNSPFSIINFQLSKAKMLEYNNNCEQNSNPQQRANIYAGDLELAHAGAADIAAVQSALHGGSELIRTAECRDEQRHKDRDHRLGALDEVAGIEVRAAGLLRRDDLLGFFDEGRDKAQCDRHHHGQLMHRRVQLFERRKQTLESVGQLNR